MNAPESTKGTLYLLPVSLSDGPIADVLPPPVLARLRALTSFVVENARTARAMLKAAGHPAPIQSLYIAELNEHTPTLEIPPLLAPLLNGQDVGLMSEAGCPAIADPGAQLVAAAHVHGIPVRPLVGPSSILLALMASGLTGQRFAFLGYLPPRDPQRAEAIQAAERRSATLDETQIFIETPYRNVALLDALLSRCAAGTRLTVATALTSPDEFIRTQSVAAWRTMPPSEREQRLNRRPTVFLLASDRAAVSESKSRPADSPARRRQRRSAD